MLTKMYAHCTAFLCTLKNDERGVTAIEYALVAVAIAGVVGVAFADNNTEGLGKVLQDAFTEITNIIQGN